MAGFDRHLRDVIGRATDEARQDGSATVEVRHLMLALAEPGTTVGSALAGSGLDRAAIRELFDREFAHSLGTVGVSPASFDLPRATPDPHRSLQLGAGVHLAVERAAKNAAGAAPRPTHLLLAILRAEVGPAARALAGIDRAALERACDAD